MGGIMLSEGTLKVGELKLLRLEDAVTHPLCTKMLASPWGHSARVSDWASSAISLTHTTIDKSYSNHLSGALRGSAVADSIKCYNQSDK